MADTEKKTRRKRARSTPEDLAAPQTSPSSGEVVHVTDSPHSVELSRDAKGQARWTIKLYGEDMDNVVDEVMRLDRRLQNEADQHD